MEAGKTESWAVAHSPIRYLKFGPIKAHDQCKLKTQKSFSEKLLEPVFTIKFISQNLFSSYGSNSYNFRKLKKKHKTDFIYVKPWR